MTENDDNDTTDDVETLVLAREGGVLVRRRHAAPLDATGAADTAGAAAQAPIDAER